MKLLRYLSFFVIFFSASIAVFAQGYEIKGKVTDSETGETMIGVNIIVAGDVHGTVSGYDGKFILKSKIAPPFTLRFSFVGYETQEIQVSEPGSRISDRK
jgi:iron complex outermembrane receptor protein